MSTVPATATIIVRNESSNIVECINSVSFFDEVLVVDSGSIDDTVAKAKQLGARVIVNQWPGFSRQRQFATENASNEWVFSIDADERVSDELRHAIERVFEDGTKLDGYQINRRNHFMGQALAHGEGYPDWLLRLFHRGRAEWSHDAVHERVKLNGRIGKIKGDLNHHSQESLDAYFHKQNMYSSLQAKSMWESGRRSSLLKIAASPTVRFLKFYVMRLGFLDGVPGLVHIAIGCFSSFAKYAKLRELEINGGAGLPEDDPISPALGKAESTNPQRQS